VHFSPKKEKTKGIKTDLKSEAKTRKLRSSTDPYLVRMILLSLASNEGGKKRGSRGAERAEGMRSGVAGGADEANCARRPRSSPRSVLRGDAYIKSPLGYYYYCCYYYYSGFFNPTPHIFSMIDAPDEMVGNVIHKF
jgi:hypothetical protein